MNNREEEYNNRFKDAPWYEKCQKETIIMVGVGGIGSNAMHCLYKTIPCMYYLIDDDMVEAYNVGSQFFTPDQIGKYKVYAVKHNALVFGSLAKITSIPRKFSGEEYAPIMITGLDNMAARKQTFETWKKESNRELFIDGRLRANLYEVYVVTPGREEAYEKTLFDDSETDEGPCTFKQTSYMAMLIGARITQVVVNYLINKYSEDEEEVCSLPSVISEFSEPFYISVL